MAPKPPLLFLSHRIPYPPDKGDKIRSYHVLRHLSTRFRVFLGTFYDDPADEGYIEAVGELCEEAAVLPLDRRLATLRCVPALATGEPLTDPYYRDRRLQRWLDALLAREAIDRVYVFSSSMAQYALQPRLAGARVVIDFVDVDSDKWAQYADSARWLNRFVYGREARRLAVYENASASRVACSLFVSEAEATLFRSRLRDTTPTVRAMGNGVDTEYFSPALIGPSPYDGHEQPIVFTGAMDYWANADAVQWFAEEVFPRVLERTPRARFYIIGHNPNASVQKLAGKGVVVTGRVKDVRPYIGHAALCVAPMRIARGIQNKILEALSLGKRVLTTSRGVEGIGSPPPSLLVRDTAAEWVDAVAAELTACAAPDGEIARGFILNNFSWSAQLGCLDDIFAV